MSKRPFNKAAYNQFDKSAKTRLVEIIEKNYGYVLDCDLDVEMYKGGDVWFKRGGERVLFENEVRDAFDDIINRFPTIHIPIRKQNTPANYYLVWKKDLNEFISINKETLDKNRNNIAHDVQCNHELNQDGPYIEDFVDIPKEETKWFIIGPNLELQESPYD
jgi:hypothetical protein